MKILIISRTPWNSSNSFGNTFSNLFGGMNGVEIYNICCQSGSITNDIVMRTLQMSESSVLRSFLGGSVVVDETTPTNSLKEDKISNTAKKYKSTSLLLIRDAIWMFGNLKYRKVITDFIEDVKPDIIYLPIYASLYMCDIQLFSIKQSVAPIIGHISDDVYSYPPVFSFCSLSHLYRWILRKKIENIISKTSYLEVFAQNMKEEYELLFKKPCYVIGKCVDPNQINLPRKNTFVGDIVHFVYTGGVGGERFDVLLKLGHVLDRQRRKRCILDIYSATCITSEMKKEMERIKSIAYHGAVSGDEIDKIQKEADILVHVEGFSKESIFSAKMSFSTKIIDYLSSGNILFAIGPAEINSIQVIENNNIGVVNKDLNKLKDTVNELLYGGIDVDTIKMNAYNYLSTKRSKQQIQQDILNRMKKLCM